MHYPIIFGWKGLLLATSLTFLCAFAAWGEDWPFWTGPSGRNVALEENLPGSFDRTSMVNVKWVAPLGAVAFGCPTVSRGRVFVGTNHGAVRDDARFSDCVGGVVACLDESTGERLWTLVTPERVDGLPEHTHMIHQRWGICSSPTVDGDRVYVVTNGDDVLCLDVHGLANGNDGPFQDEASYMTSSGRAPIELAETDADIIWRYDIPRELEVAPHDVGSCSVLIHGDVLYTSTSNGIGEGSPVNALNPDAPAFIALDKRTGKLLAVEGEGISERLFHAQWSSPSKGRVGDRTLIFLGGGDGVCYAFEAISAEDVTGPLPMKAVWRYDCNPEHYKFANGKRIYYYQGDVKIFRRKRREGHEVRGFNSGNGSFVGPCQIIATPVFSEGRVYVAIGRDPEHGLGRGVLHCIDARQSGDITESGKVWSYQGLGRTLCTVSVNNGLVYAADLGGRLHCLDAVTGKLHWIHDTKSETWGGPLVADGKLYLNTKKAFWILAASEEKQVLFTSKGGSECAPIAANGVVYAYIRGRLYALAKN